MAIQKHWFDMMQHDRYFDDNFRDAGAVPEVKTSDADGSNRGNLTRLMMTFFVQIPLGA